MLTFDHYCINLYWKASFKRDKMEAVDKILAGKYPAKQHAKRVCTGSYMLPLKLQTGVIYIQMYDPRENIS